MTPLHFQSQQYWVEILLSLYVSNSFFLYSPFRDTCDHIVLLSQLIRVQLFTTMDYSLPGSSVHGILQARVLEWIAMHSSRL